MTETIPPVDGALVVALAEALPVSVLVVDRRGRIAQAAGDHLRDLGVDHGAVSRHVDAVDTRVPDLAADCRRALDGETVVATATTDGGTFEVTYAPLESPDGIAGAVAAARPRTATADGSAAESRDRPLPDEASIMAVSIEKRDGVPCVGDCNRALLESLGYERGEVVGRPLAALYTADSAERMAGIDEPSWAEESFRIVPRTLVAADGRTIRTLLHAAPERSEDGSVIGTRALYFNLSGHDRVRRELRESRDKIAKLHDTASRLMACREEGAVYERAVEAAEEILEFDICGIDTVEDGYFVPKAISTGMTSDGYERMPVGEGIAGKTYRTGDPYLVDDVREMTDAKPAQDAYRSILSLPMGEIGVFQAGSRRIGAFDGTDIEPAELLLSHVAAAVNRIRSERARRESEEKYRTLVEQSTEGIVIYRGEEYLFVNDRFCEITGYAKPALFEQEVSALVHPDDRNWVLRLSQRRCAGKQVPSTYEARIVTADGGAKHCEFSVTEIAYEGATASLVSIRDITARKEREETLNALQEATREMMAAKTPCAIADLLAETATDVLDYPVGAVWFLDEDEGVLRPASATETSVLAPLSTLDPGSGAPWEAFDSGETLSYEYLREDDAPETPMHAMVASPLGDHGVFVAASTADDELAPSQIDLVKLLAANAEAALDRAEREILLRDREGELEAQNEKLEFLNSLLRHNILNGMTVVLGRVELLKEDAPPDRRDQLETVSTWGEDIVDLIRKIRRVMDTAIGRGSAEPEPVDLHGVLRPEIRKIRDSYAAAEVTVDLGEEVAVLADEMLGEIFENLLSNAVVHNDGDEPVVRVEVTRGDDVVRVHVRDNGPGIPPERRDEIFGRGEKGATSSGTGYGLYLSATIVDQYGGDLYVAGDDGRGAEFVVELPYAP